MTNVWPLSLVQTPLWEPVKENAPPISIRSTTSKGRPRYRQIASTAYFQFAVSVELRDLDDYEVFHEFYYETCGEAGQPFTWFHPQDPDTEIECTFMPGALSIDRDGLGWKANFTIEVTPS